jgi:hypothetical protein
MVAAIHALTATVFVALGMRNKAVASILTAAAMPANDIFLFTNATGFRHMPLSAGTVQHEKQYTRTRCPRQQKKASPNPLEMRGFFPA